MFQELNQRVHDCLQSSFSSTEYYKYFAPDGPHTDLNQLGTRIEVAQECMRLKRIPDLDSQTEACLKKQLGHERFIALYSAQSEPTLDERHKTSACFDTPNVVDYSTATKPDAVTLGCLKLYIGDDRFQQLQSGQAHPTPEEIALGRECMNLDTTIVKPPLIIETPEEQVNCLENVVGKDRLQAVSSGQDTATQDEQNLAQQCFEQQASVQTLFLPPPPEQVFFIPESKQDVAIESITGKTSDNKNTFQLTGKGPPDSTVDIYIFSEPIVISTNTDQNGDWTYELSYHLPEGNHQAYTVIRHPEKGLVRSEVFSIDVAYALEDTAQFPEQLIVTPQKQDTQKNYLIAAAAIVLAAIGMLIIILRYMFNNLLALQSSHNKDSDPVLTTADLKSSSKTSKKS